MKTIVLNLSLALVIAVASFAGASAQARQASFTTVAEPATSQPVVTYLGSGEEQMSFNLRYENLSGTKFLLTVLDDSGEVLFDQVFTDKKFSKTFKVPSDLGKLSFVIRDLRTKEQKKVLVSTERRFVEEVSVTRLN
ncbi:MAG: hypothetical protein JST39_02155 [Bacteroidetes bacterium]|nr:hypothetical protein [Bacteroidota bacterium]